MHTFMEKAGGGGFNVLSFPMSLMDQTTLRKSKKGDFVVEASAALQGPSRRDDSSCEYDVSD